MENCSLRAWARRIDPEGKSRGIGELLKETNKLLKDSRWPV